MAITERRLQKIIREEIENISKGMMGFDRHLRGASPPPLPPESQEPRRGGRGPIMALYYTRIEEHTGDAMGDNFEQLLNEMNDDLFGGHLSIRFGDGYDTYVGQTDTEVVRGDGKASRFDELTDSIAVVGPLEDLKELVAAVTAELRADFGPYEQLPDHEIVPLSEPD
jgi:hypothetical protein